MALFYFLKPWLHGVKWGDGGFATAALGQRELGRELAGGRAAPTGPALCAHPPGSDLPRFEFDSFKAWLLSWAQQLSLRGEKEEAHSPILPPHEPSSCPGTDPVERKPTALRNEPCLKPISLGAERKTCLPLRAFSWDCLSHAEAWRPRRREWASWSNEPSSNPALSSALQRLLQLSVALHRQWGLGHFGGTTRGPLGTVLVPASAAPV